MATTVLMLVGMLLAALLVEPLVRRIHLPFAALLVLAGFVGSELLVANGIDTGVRASNFPGLILYVLLPLLVFESAYHTDLRQLLRGLPMILMLAVPMLVLSVVITALGVWAGINHPGFPWTAALLAGVLLSATDPTAIIALLNRSTNGRRLAVMLNGESLLNDALIIVLFSIVLSMALAPQQAGNWQQALPHFVRIVGGGMLVGVAVGALAALLLKLFHGTTREAVVTLISAYAALLIAQQVFQVSGIVATLCTGLILGTLARRGQMQARRFIAAFWRLAAWIAYAMMFLLMGVTVTLEMFSQRWLAILITIVAVLLARSLAVGVAMLLVSPLPGSRPHGVVEGGVLVWGGLRGGVTLALALALPVQLDYWWTIQAIAFGTVLFTLFVQAPTLPLLLKRLHYAEHRPNKT